VSQEREVLAVVPKRLDLVIKRGVDFPIVFTLTNGEAVAVDITGDAILFRVYDRPGGTLLFQVAGAITTAASGITTVTIADTDTAIAAFSTTDSSLAWYDLLRTEDASGDKGVYFEGDLVIHPIAA